MSLTESPLDRLRTSAGSILGNSVVRREDPGLLVGAERYVGDLMPDGVVTLHFVRSIAAHGDLRAVHADDARRAPGVVGVFVADDLSLDAFQSWSKMADKWARPPIARDRVRFVGDIVAVVAAESSGQAADAADLTWCEIDSLPAVTDAHTAATSGAPALFEHSPDNVCFEVATHSELDPCSGAAHVTELTMTSQRLSGVPMETNGVVVVPFRGQPTVVYAATQNPNVVHEELCRALKVGPSEIRVVAPAVGGGFGPKSHAYPEFIVAAAVARILDRPVRWIETRTESMMSMTHGRDMRLTGRLGTDPLGKIVGLDVDVVANAGAYPALGGYLIKLTQLMSVGVYDIPLVRFRGRSIATNTTPTGAYRGAGRPEAAQLIERLLDVASDELSIDPVEIRRMNLLSASGFPHTTQTGALYDSGDYEKALDAALSVAKYRDLRDEQAIRRARGDVVQLGIGVSSYVEVTAPDGTHAEYGSVELLDDGTVLAKVGTSSHGQGHDTTFSMVVADALGISMEQVIVLQSDTDVIPRGSGTFGSRSLQTAGAALNVAALRVLTSVKELAANVLEASADDIEVRQDRIGVVGVPSKTFTWAELATFARDEDIRPSGCRPGLQEEVDFDAGGSTYPFGSHVAVVEVDTETGEVRLIRHVAVDDCGELVNPMIVRGQQHGGIAQGAAQALFEAVVYDDDGNLKSTNLMDYAIPSAAELPFFEATNTVTPTPRNPLGAKGIGESGTIGSTPAIHNAVVDAVSHLGVRHIDMPLTPMRVWQAIGCVPRPTLDTTAIEFRRFEK